MHDVSRETIVKAAQGDLAAFEAIFKQYSDYVFNIALRIAQNKEDAEEITQEVFLETYRKLSGFRFQSHLGTWIYRITINTAINFKKKNVKIVTVTYNDAVLCPHTENSINEKIEKEYKESFIDSLLRKLTPEQRRCLELRVLHGLSYRQIAKTLKINLSSVRSRLKRARKKLLDSKKEVILDVM